MSAGRRTAALLLLGVCSSVPLTAQWGPARFSGISAGATRSEVSGGFTPGTRWGGTAGLFYGATMSRNAVLQFEGNWIQKGGGDHRVSSLELPVLLGLASSITGGVFIKAYTGLALAFKLSCNGPDTTANTCDSVNGKEWSWPIGLELGKQLEDRTFVAVDLRYSRGLSDVVPTTASRHRTWQLRLILGTPIGQ